ncbi:MAG: hypothetical protein RLZ97_2760 [Verrucomicrobiota bacterium]
MRRLPPRLLEHQGLSHQRPPHPAPSDHRRTGFSFSRLDPTGAHPDHHRRSLAIQLMIITHIDSASANKGICTVSGSR